MYGNMKDFEALIGNDFAFHGVDNNCFKLGNRVFEAVEDEDDGYRSYLGSVEVRDVGDLIFFRDALATVRVERMEGDPDGIRMIDVADGHVWLSFGTENTDDYYPWFFFTYAPKAA